MRKEAPGPPRPRRWGRGSAWLTAPEPRGASGTSSVLQRGDAVDLDERVAGNPSGGGDRRADRGLRAEAAEEHLVHRRVVLQVVQVDVDLQDLLHRGADLLELLLDLVEHVLRVGLDVALEVGTDAGDEDKAAVRGDAAEEGRLLGPLAVRPVHLL